MSAKLTKARETARDLYQQAIDALGDPTFWREWRREKDREDMLRSLMSNRVGRAAGRPVSAGETEGWMDIASAPRDGSEMLLYAHLTDDQGSLTHCFGVGRWWNDDGGAFGWDFDSPPTHWRPLPPPPSAMLSAGGEGDGHGR